MQGIYKKAILTLILIASAIGLYYGWKLFWFMTDDAYIAFRYVSNSILGYGYTWNPPPFKPVEGYTSFLWVVILDFVWRVFKILPPQSSNYLSLGFSYLTLLLIIYAVLRMNLHQRIANLRYVFLSLILLGILTNRTFLAWTSSGLETALFNFCLTLWVIVSIYSKNHSYSWLFGITGSAILVYLSRPDGILIVLGTILMIVFLFSSELNKRNLHAKQFIAISPLMVVPIHLGWRRFTYGEWLPNTYYAKHVAPWPEAGLKYFASFVMEYALWVWFLLLASIAVLLLLKYRRELFVEIDVFVNKIEVWYSSFIARPNRLFCLTIVVITIVAHVVYYTLIIGGDHFEYRVYSYLVPLIFVSFLWMVNFLNFRAAVAILLFCAFIFFSYPIPWTHWKLTKDRNTRAETYLLKMPVRYAILWELRFIFRPFDNWQSWLIDHHICNRYQEHKIFFQYQEKTNPPRTMTAPLKNGKIPVKIFPCVGVPGWVYPRTAIIDEFGLNDYVIARNRVPIFSERMMAHDRVPPKGYLESFQTGDSLNEFTPKAIVANETYWINKIVNGIDTLRVR